MELYFRRNIYCRVNKSSGRESKHSSGNTIHLSQSTLPGPGPVPVVVAVPPFGNLLRGSRRFHPKNASFGRNQACGRLRGQDQRPEGPVGRGTGQRQNEYALNHSLTHLLFSHSLSYSLAHSVIFSLTQLFSHSLSYSITCPITFLFPSYYRV